MILRYVFVIYFILKYILILTVDKMRIKEDNMKKKILVLLIFLLLLLLILYLFFGDSGFGLFMK